MGYGRIQAYHALDFADVIIRDFPGDTGVEPSTPAGGDFWDYSDIVVRPTDDNVFQPTNLALAKDVTRGQTNYIYVRIVNEGPAVARNVKVDLRITPFVGVQFSYPGDWTAIDANHVQPTAIAAGFPTLAVGSSVIAKFSVSAAQVEQLWGWISGMHFHPCMVASVSADNDYAFADAAGGVGLITKRNNLAQRNLSVIPAAAGASVTFPFIVGNIASLEKSLQLIVDRSGLSHDVRVSLLLEEDAKTLLPHFTPAPSGPLLKQPNESVNGNLAATRSIATLEPQSLAKAATQLQVEGGVVGTENNRRVIDVQQPQAQVRLVRAGGAVQVLAVRMQIPATAKKGDSFPIRVLQRNEQNQVVGGATVVYVIE